MRNYFIFVGLMLTIFYSCRDEEILTDSSAKLKFSTDTVMFDTVFNGIGSATKRFQIYNRHNQPIKISSLWLARGQSSCFKINVDGMAENQIDGLEIKGGDSLFVFVEVRINPSTNDLLERDSVCFSVNGNIQHVKLLAFGQNVHLLSDQVIETQTWTSEKPYLIYKTIMVGAQQTLTIKEGTRLYFHRGASLIVAGRLLVQGTKAAPVIFQGDRLESFYDDKPGQWGGVYTDSVEVLLGGIHFAQGSFGNQIDYAIIKNAIKGIEVDPPVEPTIMLTISNTIISNMNLFGILGKTTSIVGNNLVINNCGVHAIVLAFGGQYRFNHTTIANYNPYTIRNTASLALNNYYVNDNIAYAFDLDVTFTNSIIYGSGGENGNEIVIDYAGEGVFNYMFDHCMVKLGDDFDTSDETHFKNLIVNPDGGPRFVSRTIYDFQLDTLSPAIDAGKMDYGLQYPIDLNGVDRTTDAAPDMGAYER